MAFNEFETKKIEKIAETFLNEHRPPPNIRNRLDIGWRPEKQSIFIFETRPRWDSPSEYHNFDIAKSTFVRSQGEWKIYWMRRDLRWHGYEPKPQVKTIEQVFKVVAKDQYGCFFS